MKSILVLGVVILLSILTLFSACQNDERATIRSGDLPSSIETEAPDDIVFTPGGYAYRANVNGSGPGELIPDIETVNVTLDGININYRDYIETKAGETRNNIIFIWREEGFHDNELDLYSEDVPDELELSQIQGGGRPGILLHTLAMEILPGVSPGQYTLQIGIQIDGEDYGTIPCTLQVIE